MGEVSGISWTHGTFNPIVGCQKVSEACTNCYAEREQIRYGYAERWRGVRHITAIGTWGVVRKLQRAAEKDGRRRRLFCASLSDVFEDHETWVSPLSDGYPVDPERRRTSSGVPVRQAALELMESATLVDSLLLTKRPENIRRFVPARWLEPGGWPKHVWIGTTVESQKHVRRVAHLLEVPAAIRFVSAEPLLGPLDLTRIVTDDDELGVGYDALRGKLCGNDEAGGPRIHWVITGGESGPQARPSRTDWFRSLRDQCERAGTAYHHKQQGEWAPMLPGVRYSTSVPSAILDSAGKILPDGVEFEPGQSEWMVRVGKTASGWLLDGREHREFPVTP